MKKVLFSFSLLFLLFSASIAQDVEVVSITSPNNTSGCMLTATETVTINLRNNGTENITDIPVSYTINGGVSIEETVTVTIATGETYSYSFTQTTDLSAPDLYEIVATASLTGDTNPANDAKTITVTNKDATITIELKTDVYATETSWKLFDREDNIIQQGSGYSNSTLYTFNVCVYSTGCYHFVLYDSYGDGLAGNGTSTAGYLTVKYNGTQVGGFTTANANFGSEYGVYAMGDGCTIIDLNLTSVNTPVLSPAGEIAIPCKITNAGEVPITSFDMTYKINGGTESSVYSVTGQDIAVGGSYELTHNEAYNFDTEGLYEIEVTISNVNGGAEPNTDNNVLSTEISISNSLLERKIILENFTTGQCPNCPPIHTLLENYVASQPRAILIAQHAGYYTDQMTIPENTELLAMYNAGGGTYAPALTIDRFRFSEGLTGGSPDPGPVFWPGESTSATTTRMNDRLDVPAGVGVNISGTINTITREINLTVSGSLVADIPLSLADLRLVVYVKEDGLIYNQAGGSSTYEHNNVMRDAVSATWGDDDVITSNEIASTFTKDYAYTLNAAWNIENMAVVAFVANYDADVNNREILNAEEISMTELTNITSVNEIENSFSIYPNPVSEKLYLKNCNKSVVEIYDILGKIVLTTSIQDDLSIIDVSHLNTGTYSVKISNGKNTAYQKIFISK